MWFFKKKKEEIQPIEIKQEKPKECQHIWRDFDWYLEYEWHRYSNRPKYGYYTIKVIEPYVCCLCKKRENHIIDKEHSEDVEEKDFVTKKNEMKDKYKDYLNERAIIEDQIRDMQKNIDREFLQTLSVYFPKKTGAPLPIEMKLTR